LVNISYEYKFNFFIVYYNEWLNKEHTCSRDCFKIKKHPKLEKIWIGTKSMNVSITEKLKQVRDKIDEIDA
jgi:hypothetical protein